MNMSHKLLPLLARIFLGLIFFMSGLNKINDFSNVSQQMQEAGLTYQTNFFLVCAIIFLLLGSALLISGYKIKIGALLLILFLVPVTITFHSNIADPNEIVHLLKNIGILGGLLMVLSFGGGDLVIGKK